MISKEGKCLECHWYDYSPYITSDTPIGTRFDIDDFNYFDPWRGTIGEDTDLTLPDSSVPYFPVLIFLNPYDGRCTADCRGEGRNYKNPISYDPNDVGTFYPSAYTCYQNQGSSRR